MSSGPAHALSRRAVVNPISNAPVTPELELEGIPDEYRFEIFRLRRRVQELESALLDKNDRVRHCLAMIEDELLFWRTGLYLHIWETHDAITRRIIRLEATLAILKDIQPRKFKQTR